MICRFPIRIITKSLKIYKNQTEPLVPKATMLNN